MKKTIACLLVLVFSLSAAAGMAANLTFSWWGDTQSSQAARAAVSAFTEETEIGVDTVYSSGRGWEEKLNQYFAYNAAFDVNQIEWRWIASFVDALGDSMLYDLYQVDDLIDLTQFDEKLLQMCTVKGELLAIPVSLTGRAFFWNKSAFERFGLETPKSLADLMTAGEAFAGAEDEECYPLALDAGDKMSLMTLYLESRYGKAWIADGKLNYSAEQIAEGMQFIRDLEDGHVIPPAELLEDDGAESIALNDKWADGQYAGVWAWDTAAPQLADALSGDQELIVGDYFADMGAHKGGCVKIGAALSIAQSSLNKQSAAELIQYLLSDAQGAKLFGASRGVPVSAAGLEACSAEGLIHALMAEANAKAIAACPYWMDASFEDARLNGQDGVYAEVFRGLSSESFDAQEAAQILMEEIQSVLEYEEDEEDAGWDEASDEDEMSDEDEEEIE